MTFVYGGLFIAAHCIYTFTHNNNVYLYVKHSAKHIPIENALIPIFTGRQR